MAFGVREPCGWYDTRPNWGGSFKTSTELAEQPLITASLSWYLPFSESLDFAPQKNGTDDQHLPRTWGECQL